MCHGQPLILGGPCADCGMPRHPGPCRPSTLSAEVLAVLRRADVAISRKALDDDRSHDPPPMWSYRNIVHGPALRRLWDRWHALKTEFEDALRVLDPTHPMVRR